MRIIAPIMIWNPVPFLVDVFDGKNYQYFLMQTYINDDKDIKNFQTGSDHINF